MSGERDGSALWKQRRELQDEHTRIVQEYLNNRETPELLARVDPLLNELRQIEAELQQLPEPGSDDRPPCGLRWRSCWHEAGHIVSSMVLLGAVNPWAMVFGEGEGGVAYNTSRGDPLQSFDDAVSSAAGHAAGELASRYDPPEQQPTADGGEPCAGLQLQNQPKMAEHLNNHITDAERVAVWCCRLSPDTPEMWVEEHERVHREAALFVRAHVDQLLPIAQQLYLVGVGFPPKQEPAEAAEIVSEVVNDEQVNEIEDPATPGGKEGE